jgi:hypothetical protein
MVHIHAAHIRLRESRSCQPSTQQQYENKPHESPGKAPHRHSITSEETAPPAHAAAGRIAAAQFYLLKASITDGMSPTLIFSKRRERNAA